MKTTIELIQEKKKEKENYYTIYHFRFCHEIVVELSNHRSKNKESK